MMASIPPAAPVRGLTEASDGTVRLGNRDRDRGSRAVVTLIMGA